MVRSYRSLRISLGALLLLAFGCTTGKVIREGKGWREVEGRDSGKSVIEMMTDDPGVLADLAKTAPDARVRTEALLRVKDPGVLAEMVRIEADPAVRLTVVGRLSDERVLRDLAQNDRDDGVRQAAAARADVLKTVDSRHPEYAGWAACKPGTWVKLKVDLRVNDSRSSIEIVRTLLECSSERAILEQKVVSTGKGPQGYTRDLLTRFDVAYGRKVEDDGDLTLQGRTAKCKWVRYNFQRGGDVAQIRRWLRDEVPGGVARIDMEVSPEGQPLSHLTAVATAWERR
jgi:hypothetical protein